MTFETLTPMLTTWDIPGSVSFYTTVLGFTCTDQTSSWASLRRDGVGLMLSEPNAHRPECEPAFTGSLYFRTTDVDAVWSSLADRARVCYPLENFDYGMREFAIYDNNGYLLQFGQPVPAVQRAATRA